MKEMSIDELWNRIKAHEGEVFYQIRGQEFTYTINSDGKTITPSTTKWNIRKNEDFGESLKLVPLQSTVPVQKLYGPSYIYAIVMDARICEGYWDTNHNQQD